MAKISKIGDLKVCRKLVNLHLRVHKLSLVFPKFELFELGSQVRRSSNSAPANLAEGFNNKYRNIYLQTITRALGEIRETQHHLMVVWRKQYLTDGTYKELVEAYNECSRMLRGIQRALGAKARTDTL